MAEQDDSSLANREFERDEGLERHNHGNNGVDEDKCEICTGPRGHIVPSWERENPRTVTQEELEDDLREILVRPAEFNVDDLPLEDDEKAKLSAEIKAFDLKMANAEVQRVQNLREIDAICLKHGIKTPELGPGHISIHHGGCSLERNGFANIVMILRDWQKLGTLKAVERIEEQAEIGLVFIDMHNQGLRPYWHEAIAEQKRRKDEAAKQSGRS